MDFDKYTVSSDVSLGTVNHTEFGAISLSNGNFATMDVDGSNNLRLRSYSATDTLINTVTVGVNSLVFSEEFTFNTTPSSTIVNNWVNFLTALDAITLSNIGSITVEDSATGFTATTSNSTEAQGVITNLTTPTQGSIGLWYVDLDCGSGTPFYNGRTVSLIYNGGDCSCSGDWVIRPQINNNNWGGSNGNTCSRSTRTLSVTVELL